MLVERRWLGYIRLVGVLSTVTSVIPAQIYPPPPSPRRRRGNFPRPAQLRTPDVGDDGLGRKQAD